MSRITQCASRLTLLALILAILFASPVLAQESTPEIPNEGAVSDDGVVSDDAVNAVAKDMFCPVCENVPLDVCPTQACAQWRDLIRQRLGEGWTEQQIKDYFVRQYGDRVLAEPPRTGLNWLVYVIPPIIVLAGAFIVLRVLRGWKAQTVQSSPGNALPTIDDDYVSRLKKNSNEETNLMETTSPQPDTLTTSRRSFWGWLIVWVGLISLLVLVAMGLRRTQEGPITIGSAVPDFTFTTFSNEEIKLSDLKGKVVVINFGPPGADLVKEEAADLEAAWRHYKPRGDVVFLGMDYVDTEPEAMGYLARFDITYTNGPDLRTSISQMFRITGVPETYFIDKEGHLAAAKISPFQNLQEITATIDPLLEP